MTNIIERPFSLTRDFRSIMWGATLQYNVLRAACAGVVLAIVMLIVLINAPRGQGPPIVMIFLLPVLWPIAFFVFVLPVSLILGFLSDVIPMIGWVPIIYTFIGVTVGDPLVCMLRRFAPRVVPVERPSFLSLRPIWYVLKPQETNEFVISR